MRTLIALALAGTVAAQGTWSVDAGGGGDFSTLTAAVAAPQVVDGDTLLVEPGTYAAFTTGKALHIIGRSGVAAPSVHSESRLEGCASATIAGVNFEELVCRDIPGRLVIEDCDIGHAWPGNFGGTVDSFLLENCAEVVVSNGLLTGAQGDLTHGESTGVTVRTSVVALVNCTIFGGKGADADSLGYPGQPAVLIRDLSVVTIAGSNAWGGTGGNGVFGFCQSWGGAGIDVEHSTLWVRGNEDDLIRGGDDCPWGSQAFAIDGGWSKVTVSGVVLEAPALSPGLALTGQLVQPSVDQPFLWIGGNSEPGTFRRLNLAGPLATTAGLLFSFQPALVNSSKFVGGPLWLDPGAVFMILNLSLAGQELPITVNLPLPDDAGFAGVTANAQAFLSIDGSKFLVTNPATIVLRF